MCNTAEVHMYTFIEALFFFRSFFFFFFLGGGLESSHVCLPQAQTELKANSFIINM